MNTTKANLLIEKLENGLQTAISNLISTHLGVYVPLQSDVKHYNHCGWVIKLVEVGNTTTKMLTSTPLLAQMFEKAQLVVRMNFSDHNDNDLWLRIGIEYDHNFNLGSNGCDLMEARMDINTFDAVIRKSHQWGEVKS